MDWMNEIMITALQPRGGSRLAAHCPELMSTCGPCRAMSRCDSLWVRRSHVRDNTCDRRDGGHAL